MIQILAARSKKPGEKPVFGLIPGVGHLWVPSLNQALTGSQAILDKIPENERWNLFYTLAHHRVSGTDRYPSRTASSFEYQTALAFDIDAADTARAIEYATPVAEVLRIKAEDTIVVASGNGVHVIVALKYPVSSATAFSENRDAYKEILHKIKLKMEVMGLPGTPDPSIFDPARVLRLPGTVNRKPSKADTECRLVQATPTTHDLDLFELSGLKAIAAENVTPAELKRQFPTPDFAEMRKECRFMAWAEATPAEVHEPQMFDFLSLLAPQKDPAAKELAAKSYTGAINSQSLQRQDFEKKWEDAARYGGRKCATIAARWEGCSSCPHHEKIVSPFQLKSKGHLSSEGNGFWVLGSKGQHLHPHYEDLAVTYEQQGPLRVVSGERILRFEDSFFGEIEELPIKGYLDKTVKPTEPLREQHRNEFLHRIKASNVLNPAAEKQLFETSIKAKLNCRNGVVDILTGKLLSHSSDFGFRYVLPYDFDESSEGSEFFLDWLAQVTKNRPDLMEALLDVMAYVLWPSYEDAMLCYFTGVGANGKSTLLHIIQEMVGQDNYSAVSMSQLTENRFAAAALEGKLVNVSGESSGVMIDFEKMNILKALSVGEEIQVEKKNQHAFVMRNKAKLIFSANEPPIFREQGRAVKRRLLVIPFDHIIEDEDPGVESRLLKEIPAILAMLVRRIPGILRAGGGSFKLRRGGREAALAQKKMLTAGDSVCIWAKERIQSSVDLPETATIRLTDAYVDYSKWCAESGYQKPVNKNVFSKALWASVLTPAACKEDGSAKSIRNGKEVYAGYRHTKFVGSGDSDAL